MDSNDFFLLLRKDLFQVKYDKTRYDRKYRKVFRKIKRKWTNDELAQHVLELDCSASNLYYLPSTRFAHLALLGSN